MLLEDYPDLFRALPMSCLILDKDFIIREMTDTYLQMARRDRGKLWRHSYFEVFEDSPQDPERAMATKEILHSSLVKVRDELVEDHLPISRFDMPDENGKLEPRYWVSWSIPLLDHNGTLMYILHRVEDVTKYVIVVNAIKNMGDSLHALSHLMASLLDGPTTSEHI